VTGISHTNDLTEKFPMYQYQICCNRIKTQAQPISTWTNGHANIAADQIHFELSEDSEFE